MLPKSLTTSWHITTSILKEQQDAEKWNKQLAEIIIPQDEYATSTCWSSTRSKTNKNMHAKQPFYTQFRSFNTRKAYKSCAFVQRITSRILQRTSRKSSIRVERQEKHIKCKVICNFCNYLLAITSGDSKRVKAK